MQADNLIDSEEDEYIEVPKKKEDEVPDWFELGAKVEIDGDTCDVPELQQLVGQQGVVIAIDASDTNYGYKVTVRFDKPRYIDFDGYRHGWEFNLLDLYMLKKAEDKLKKTEDKPKGVLPFAA